MKTRNRIYTAKKSLNSFPEQMFFIRLLGVIGRDFYVVPKVRVADILEASSERYFRRICALHVDYTIINPKIGEVICCIELDGSSHNKKNVKGYERDLIKNKAFEVSGVKLCRVKQNRNNKYSARHLKEVMKILTEYREDRGKFLQKRLK